MSEHLWIRSGPDLRLPQNQCAYCGAQRQSQAGHGSCPSDGNRNEMDDYAAMSPGEMYQALGCDARKWADAFSQVATMANPLGKALRSFPDGDAQGELNRIMIDWFAKAMMAQVDQGHAS